MTDKERAREFRHLEDRLTQLEMDINSLRVKQEKLLSDKSDVLQKWAVNFVATLSEDKKKHLQKVLNAVLDSDTEVEPATEETDQEGYDEDYYNYVWQKSGKSGL